MTDASPSTVAVAAAPAMSDASRFGFAHALLRRPVAVASLVWLAAITVLGLLAPVISPADPLQQNLMNLKQGPSPAHWLGTDGLGRDILSRVLHGTIPTLGGVAQALIVAALLGVVVGLVAGYFGGWIDRIMAQVIDLIFALPTIVILLSLLSVFNRNMTVAMIVLGVMGSVGIARVVRSATLGVRNELYVDAARVAGLTDARIIGRHVLPRVMGPVIVQISLFAAIAILMQTGLSFLGLGVPLPAPTWGSMVFEASQSMIDAPWMLVPSGGVIALTILAFGLIGDAARDAAAGIWSASTSTRRRARPSRASSAHEGQDDDRTPAEAGDTALTISHLTIETVEDGRVLVDDLNVRLARGETLGVVGESGSGKTLSSLAALGLLPAGTAVVSGTLRVGDAVYDLRDARSLEPLRGSRIGMIFQEPSAALDPCFTIGHQIGEVVRRVDRTPRRATHARVIELLEQVRIPDASAVARRFPHQVSGGMAQRVGIARALAGRPQMLLADEPTTALDVTVQSEILALLRQLVEAEGMAMLFVTHDWGVVADICDRALVLYRGETIEVGDIEDIMLRPQADYTKALLRANPHSAPVGKRLPTIEDTYRTLREERP